MNKIDELIQQYCPDGVEYVKLNELGSFYSGLSGKSKEDFRDGNAKFITYVNIFNNPAFNTDVEDKVKIAEGEKQNTIQYGDLLFTGSSETPDECGMCSVLTHHTDEHLYLNSFCFGFRFNDLSDKNPDFMKHLFRSSSIRKDICKTANGVTRYNISKKEFAKIEIPLPPLPVQEAIVNILDRFAEYAAELQEELQEELQARQQQYNYYRDTLLSFEGRVDVKEFLLEEITTDIYSGATPSKDKREFWENGSIPWMSSGEVNLGKVYDVEGRITQLGYDKCSTKMVPEGSVVIALAGQGKTRGTVALLKTSVCTNQSLAALVPDTNIVSGEYLYHYLRTQYIKLREVSAGDGTRGGLNLKMLRSYKIIIPPKPEQQRIVDILDRFDTLANDLSQGLPAEIEARQQQYEYYRDQLLTFKRKEA